MPLAVLVLLLATRRWSRCPNRPGRTGGRGCGSPQFQPDYPADVHDVRGPGGLPSIGTAIGHTHLPEVSLGHGVRLVRTLIRG